MLKNVFLSICFLMVHILCGYSFALRLSYDKGILEAESKQVAKMAAAGDIDGLIGMLTDRLFPSKVAAAEHLGEIGDQRALPVLKKLNEDNGGWVLAEIHHDRSGAFAVAICRILTRDNSEEEQVEALFDLLEGRGPAVPKSVEFRNITINGTSRKIPNVFLKHNFDVGKRVAAELEKHVNPAIIKRLRQSENKGAAIAAVWMEVRDMDVKDAIARCMLIARDEGGSQGYGAIHSLGKLGDDAIDALDELAVDGHRDAITVLAYQKENSKVFDLLCWHLLNNNNSRVRSTAVSSVAYVNSDAFRLKSLQTLISALYDPDKNIRSRTSFSLSTRAYKQNKPYFDQIKESLLVAGLKHPDTAVREKLMKAVVRLGYEWSDDQVGEAPAIRTDLDVRSLPPLTAEQRLKAKTDPLEKEGAKLLKMGPPEEAIKVYEELLELKGGYEPYRQALKKAKAYVKAAEATTEHWYPDAPYIGYKGRYSYYLASEPEDASTLKEEFDLALFLEGDGFEGWTSIFGKDPKGKDQFFKALKLYEHIVEFYPENEYLVIRSLAAIGGLKLNLYKDVETCVLEYVEVFVTPVEEVVDSTDHRRRNKPLEETGGKTQAQLDFELYYKGHMRERLIELCSAAVRSKPYDAEDRNLFDEIIVRCAQTDPEIVEMAKTAKAKLETESCPSHSR